MVGKCFVAKSRLARHNPAIVVSMKIPFVDKALSVLSFLNGTHGNLTYQSISGRDAGTVFQVMVR